VTVGLVLVVALTFATLSGVSAHDIPNDVTVQVFVKPDGDRLHLLVRAPLRACRDVDFPKRGPGYLDLERADASLRDAATQWISDGIQLYEGDSARPKPRVVEARGSRGADKTFASYEEALAHVTGARLPNDTELYWNQGLLDVLFEYPIYSDAADFSIHAGFAQLGLRVVTVVRFLPPGGVVRAFEFTGDPGLVRLDPRRFQAALRFVEAGGFPPLGGAGPLFFFFFPLFPFPGFPSPLLVVAPLSPSHPPPPIPSGPGVAPHTLFVSPRT